MEEVILRCWEHVDALASFLVFDARRFDVSRDEVISDFRAPYGERFDEKAMELARIGGLVQFGCNFTLPIALGRGEEAVAAAKAELDCWTPKVAARHGEVVARLSCWPAQLSTKPTSPPGGGVHVSPERGR